MQYAKNGLSLYNPILYSKSPIIKNSNSILLNIFKSISGSEDLESLPNYCLNYAILTEQYITLCALNEMIDNAITYTKNYEKLFNDLLNELSNNYDNELFWDYLYVLEEFLIKVSIISECRKLIMINLTQILEILKKAVEKEQVLIKDNKVSANYKCRYSILYFFVANKFKINSEIDDDVLFQVALEKCMNEFDVDIFNIISKYKNCDKYDLSPLDLIDEYKKCEHFKVNYFWIYAFYVIKYRGVLESTLLHILGEDIYSFWLSYVTSEEFKEDSVKNSDNLVKTYLENDITVFKSAGICTYESGNIIKRILRERG